MSHRIRSHTLPSADFAFRWEQQRQNLEATINAILEGRLYTAVDQTVCSLPPPPSRDFQAFTRAR
jgi:hypothetical protein